MAQTWVVAKSETDFPKILQLWVNDSTGHMAVEAEEALKDQIVRISVQNILLYTAFSRFKGIFGNL